MPALVYPLTLPAPSQWQGVPRERRAASSSPGNTQMRNRSRDALHDIDAQWFYTSAEMTIWRAWYEATLLDGVLWFAATVPGAGGWVSRVVKFRTKTLKLEYVGNGVYRVSAQVQQRGISEPPQVSWGITRTDTWLYKAEGTPNLHNSDYPLTDFDDSTWSSGIASVGSASGITYVSGWPIGSTTVVPAYPTTQELWLRKHTVLPAAGNVHINLVNDDNGGALWINGVSITLASVALWHQGATVAMAAGAAVFAVRVQNTGDAVYADLDANYI